MNDGHTQQIERPERAPLRHLVFGLMLIVGGIVLTLNGLGIEHVFDRAPCLRPTEFGMLTVERLAASLPPL